MRAGFMLAIFLALPAFAVDQSITIVLPTQFTNGDAIQPGDLRETRVEYGTCAGDSAVGFTFDQKEGYVVVPDPVTVATITNLSYARRYCFRAFSVAATGDESKPSNVLIRWYSGRRPKPSVISF